MKAWGGSKMNQKQKKLVRLGLFLILLLVLENWIYHQLNPKKPKAPPARFKVNHKKSQKPSPSPSPFASSSPLSSTPTQAEQEEQSASPTPSPESGMEEIEEEPFDLAAFLMQVLTFLGLAAFAAAAVLGYRWFLSAFELPKESTNPLPNLALKAGPVTESKSSRKPPLDLPTQVFVKNPPTPEETLPTQKVDAVLIDEDPQIHNQWATAAKTKNKNLLRFHSVADFIREAPKISVETDIFVDFELGGGVVGSLKSQILFEMGYKRIFLMTSGPITHMIPNWISMVVSKNPPW